MNNEPKKTIDPNDPFADLRKLEDASLWDKNGGEDVGPADVMTDLNKATVARFEENCFKCGGSGNWRPGYPCFRCKGKGKLYYKTSPEVRAEQKRRREEKKREQDEANAQAGRNWLEANPDVKIYLDEEATKNGNYAQFPRDMLNALEAFGYLTPNQEAAVRKGIARKADWAEARLQEHDIH